MIYRLVPIEKTNILSWFDGTFDPSGMQMYGIFSETRKAKVQLITLIRRY